VENRAAERLGEVAKSQTGIWNFFGGFCSGEGRGRLGGNG
jgi:hypothetical protein